MGKVGGKAQPKKSTNLNPTIRFELILDFIYTIVAKYMAMATTKA